MKPFRWDISKAEQLGRLVDPSLPGPDPDFVSWVAKVAATIVARSSGADLVFVGRSPENFFDYLSGVVADTSYQDRVHHLNFSNRGLPIAEIRAESPDAYAGLCDHLRLLGLDPAGICSARVGVCFVDLVASGGTFGHLFTFLHDWSSEEGFDPKRLKDGVHFVGITERAKSSPNARRWQQRAAWVEHYNITQIKNVAIEYRMWDWLGNYQVKVTPSNHQGRWSADAMLGPNRSEDTLAALQRAHQLYQLGRKQRRDFGRQLAQTDAAKERWARDLMAELR